MKRYLIAAVRFYRRYLSPLKPTPTCRYLPTCSAYAIDALTHCGVVRGTLKTIWRILRCNPLFPGGYDPVLPPAPLSNTTASKSNIDTHQESNSSVRV